jgi:hypothetical protein
VCGALRIVWVDPVGIRYTPPIVISLGLDVPVDKSTVQPGGVPPKVAVGRVARLRAQHEPVAPT